MPTLLERINEYITYDVSEGELWQHMDITVDISNPFADSFFKRTLCRGYCDYNDMSPDEKEAFKNTLTELFPDRFPLNGHIPHEELYQKLNTWLHLNNLCNYIMLVEHFFATKKEFNGYTYSRAVRKKNEKCIVCIVKFLKQELNSIRITYLSADEPPIVPRLSV